jgi:hypothetical protein
MLLVISEELASFDLRPSGFMHAINYFQVVRSEISRVLEKAHFRPRARAGRWQQEKPAPQQPAMAIALG